MSHVDTMADWVSEATHVLIASGAGMTAAAGFDYADRRRFAELFPAFVKKGFRARYEAIGFRGWTEEEHWAYWSIHVNDIRFGARDDKPYRDLRNLTAGKDRFVFTSNVDRLFPRNGFDELRLFTPQGDYGSLQCCNACRPVVWDSEPVVKRILECVDPETQMVTDPSVIPHCPNCGGEVFFNVRLDRNFVETPYRDQGRRLNEWLGTIGDGQLLVIEIGAGFNTPSVIRWPCERLVMQMTNARMVRINRDHPEFKYELGRRGLGIHGDAVDLLSILSPEPRA